MEIRKITAEDTWKIRHIVMWPDRDIEYVKLEKDAEGLHYGGVVEGRLIAVLSLFVEDGSAQFRKFAVFQEEQGKGYGSKLLDYVIKEAEKLGAKNIWCNARIEKTGLYEKFGLIKTKKEFDKGGKKYIIMEKKF